MILKILIVIVIIMAIPFVVAIFTKKEYHVEKMVTINRPKSTVFDYIRLLKNQDNFSVWAMMDPRNEKIFPWNRWKSRLCFRLGKHK